MEEIIKNLINFGINFEESIDAIENNNLLLTQMNSNIFHRINLDEFKIQNAELNFILQFNNKIRELIDKKHINFKILTYILHCLTLSMHKNDRIVAGSFLKQSILTWLNCEPRNIEELLSLSKILDINTSEFELSKCKLAEFKIILKLFEVTDNEIWKTCLFESDIHQLSQVNINQDNIESHLCQLILYAMIHKTSDKNTNSSFIFEKCLESHLANSACFYSENISLYYLEYICYQILKCDPDILIEIIPKIFAINYSKTSIEDKILYSSLNYTCFEAYIRTENVADSNFLKKAISILNEIYQKQEITKSTLSKSIVVKLNLLKYYLKSNEIEQAANLFYCLFFQLESNKNKFIGLNQIIGLVYYELYCYHDKIRKTANKIFVISKSLFNSFNEYHKHLSHFNVISNIDLAKLVYRCEKDDQLGKIVNISEIAKLKINQALKSKILNSTLFHFKKSGDYLMQLFVLTDTARCISAIYSDPFFVNKFKLKETLAIKKSFTRNFNELLKFLNIDQDNLNIDNVEYFFENLFDYFNMYFVSRTETLSQKYFEDEIYEFLLNLPRLNSSQDREFIAKYLEILEIFLMKNYNKIFETKKEFFYKMIGLYHYHLGGFEKCIKYIEPYAFNTSYLHLFFLNIVYKSNIKLNKLENAFQFLKNYQEKFTEYYQSILTVEIVEKYAYLLCQQSELSQLFVDYYIRQNDYESALDKLIHISKLTTYNNVLNDLSKTIGKYTIERSILTEGNRICLMFNLTSIDTDRLESYLGRHNYKIVKSSKFDLEQLNNIPKLEQLEKLENILIIVYIYCQNGKIILDLKNEITTGKQNFKTISCEEVITNYFNNHNLEHLKNVEKCFIFNLFEVSLNLDSIGSTNEHVEKVTDLRNSLDQFNFKGLSHAPSPLLMISDVFLWERHFLSENAYTEFLDKLDVYLFDKSKPLLENESLWEKIQMFGWRDGNDVWELDEYQQAQIDKPKSKNRLCIILSNTDLFCYITCSNLDDLRIGDTFDKIGLLIAFIKLNYKIELVCDKKGAEIKSYFADLCQDPNLQQYESLTLFILSHGNKKGKIFGTDGQSVNLFTDILVELNNSKYLENKEKAIFVNACRGDKKDFCLSRLPNESLSSELIDLYYDHVNDEYDHDYSDDPDDPDNYLLLERKFSNLLVCYSTIKDYVSYRDPGSGSWFIQSILQSIFKFGSNIDLVSLLQSTNRIIIRDYPPKDVIKANHLIPKQALEIVSYNWNKNYCI